MSNFFLFVKLHFFFVLFFVFFKQNTAYEMRISDWSSDVCSSDLQGHHLPVRGRRRRHRGQLHQLAVLRLRQLHHGAAVRRDAAESRASLPHRGGPRQRGGTGQAADAHHHPRHGSERSEEHTSELQSLMRTSYAVFCLKKKTDNTQHIKNKQK